MFRFGLAIISVFVTTKLQLNFSPLLLATINLNNMNDGWYGALKEITQQQQNQLVWVSEGKVGDLRVRSTAPPAGPKATVTLSCLLRRTAPRRTTWTSTMTDSPTCRRQAASTPCTARTAATPPTTKTRTQRAEPTRTRSWTRR